MRPFYYALTYVVMSLLVGLCGRRRRLGFTGFFLASLFFTPILTLIVLYVTQPSYPTITPWPPGRARR